MVAASPRRLPTRVGAAPATPDPEPADISVVRDTEAGLNERAFGGGALTLMSDPELFSGVAAADYDGDLLMSADFNDSQVYLNNGDGTFTNITDTEVIVDQSGMGGAVGDFDSDTRVDIVHVNGWLISSRRTTATSRLASSTTAASGSLDCLAFPGS